MTTPGIATQSHRQTPTITPLHPPARVSQVSTSKLTHFSSSFSGTYRHRLKSNNRSAALVTLVNTCLISPGGAGSQLAITTVNEYRKYQHMERYDIFRQTALGYCFYGEFDLAFVHGCTTHERQRITDSELITASITEVRHRDDKFAKRG